ncbi:alpha-L-fucosidase [Cyclobacterium sediminis]
MFTSIQFNIAAFLLVFSSSLLYAQVPLPSKAQLAWQNAEQVAIFHYDLHVFDGEKYNQAKNRITPIPDYNIFNPTKLDTDQWVKAAKDAGCKIAILTATHETGFALYQSDVNPYSLKAVKWQDGKGDLVRDFVASCRKYGVLPGIYIGIRWNSFYGVHDFKVNGTNQFAKERQAHYNRICEGMVEELMSRYGDWAIVWFDGGAHGPEQGGPDVLSIFEKHQPNGLFYHNLQRADIRWGGSESGTVPYPCWGTYITPSWFNNRGDKDGFKPLKHGYPEGKYYIPAMSDAPLRGYNGRHEWFWEPGDEDHIFPLEDLMNMYNKSVGRNTTLIIGLTPDQTSGSGKIISLTLPSKANIDHVIILENIINGERVRSFRIKGKLDGHWVKVFDGSVIGHKLIVPVFLENYTELKLIIDHSIGDAQILSFEAYNSKKPY